MKLYHKLHGKWKEFDRYVDNSTDITIEEIDTKIFNLKSEIDFLLENKANIINQNTNNIIYVDSTNGNDLTNLGTIDSPFKTLTYVVSNVLNKYSANITNTPISIILSEGEYECPLFTTDSYKGTLSIQGQGIGKTIITNGVKLDNSTIVVILDNLTVKSSNDLHTISAHTGQITLLNMEVISHNVQDAIAAYHSGRIYMPPTANVTATVDNSHFIVHTGSNGTFILDNGGVLTCNGTVSYGCIGADNGGLINISSTNNVKGTVTGRKYYIYNNGTIFTYNFSRDDFPGTLPGFDNDGRVQAHNAMPSDTTIDLELPESTGYIIAPDDGYIHLNVTATEVGQYCSIYDYIGGVSSYSSTNSANLLLQYPVSKGRKVYIDYTTKGPEVYFKFIYCNGNVPS